MNDTDTISTSTPGRVLYGNVSFTIDFQTFSRFWCVLPTQTRQPISQPVTVENAQETEFSTNRMGNQSNIL